MADEIVTETAPATAETPAASTSSYKDAIVLLKNDFAKFVDEAEKGFDNKAAAGRARKMSLALRKNLQEWRELSIANDKIAK